MTETKRLVFLIIGVIALSAASIGYSNAKYLSEKNAETDARLAKWRVTAKSGNLALFSAVYDKDGATTSSDNPIKHTANIIAPGAKSSTVIDFTGIDNTTDPTEVAYELKFVGTDYVTITGVDTAVANSLKGKVTFTAKSTVDINDIASVSGTLADFETTLKTLSVPQGSKVTIAWAWPYETGDDAGDTAIADLVDAGAILELDVKLAYQAVQID